MNCCKINIAGGTVQSIVASGHSTRLCVMLPEPTVRLAIAGRWEQVVTLARTHVCHLFKRKGAAFQLQPRDPIHSRMWHHFPTRSGLAALSYGPKAIDSEFQLRASDMGNLARLLRRWAPAIVDLPDAGGEREAEQDLRKALRWLDAARDAVSLTSPDALRTGRFFDSMQLFQCLRCCELLRNQSRLEVVLRRAIACVFSGSLVSQLDEYLARCGNVVPSPSAISRHRFTLDLAIMMHRRH